MRYKIVCLMFGLGVLLAVAPRTFGQVEMEGGGWKGTEGAVGPAPQKVELAFAATFDTEPAGLTSNAFSLNLGGEQFDFIFTDEGDGYGANGFSHMTVFGEGGSGSINLQSGATFFETVERVVIVRNDGENFVFNSLFVNNCDGTVVTVAGFDNGVQVGAAQTVASGTAATQDFGGLIVDEVRLTSYDFDNTNIDTFVGDTMTEMDYGDLPASYGITISANNGARHALGAIYLGDCVDSDGDGQPSSGADGDDADGTGQTMGTCAISHADEDGIVLGGTWQEGPDGGSLEATATGGSGCLSGWIDWDGDDAFSQAGDQVLDMEPVSSGTNQLAFDVPAGTFPGNGAARPFYARFRLTSDSGEVGDCSDDAVLLVNGYGGEGEVEDYLWSFSPTAVALQSVTTSTQGDMTGVTASGLLLLLLASGAMGFYRRPLDKGRAAETR